MSGQSKDAAERSAHVTRGASVPAGAGLHPVAEWKNERGQTVAAARGVVELRQENARLREALEIIAGKRQCIDNLMSNVDVARAALTPRPSRADAAPAGWDEGSNVR